MVEEISTLCLVVLTEIHPVVEEVVAKMMVLVTGVQQEEFI